MTKLEAALKLAEEGWFVHPCRPNSKVPILKSWPEAATRDPKMIENFWYWYPDANIGLAPAKSGLVCIDVDKKDGIDGEKEMYVDWDLCDLQPSLVKDQTPVVKTPSGGNHVYIQFTGDQLGNSAKTLLKGVDIRGFNGNAVGPGSEIDGVRYEWVGEHTRADTAMVVSETHPAFNRFQAHARRHDTREEANDIVVEELDMDANVMAAVEWLNEHHQPCIQGEGADENAFVAAHFMREMGLSRDMARDVMFRSNWNQKAIDKDGKLWPWTEDELDVKIDNAWRYPQNPCGHRSVVGRSIEYKLGTVEHGTTFEKLKDLSMAQARADAAARAQRRNDFFLCGNEVTSGVEDIRWLVEGVIPDHGTCALAAREKTGKTFMAIDLGLHVATGKKWNGRETRQSHVLYIAAEYSEGVRRRVAAWCKHHNEEVPNTFTVLRKNLDITAEDDAKMLLEYCRDNDVKFVIIDTLTRAMKGKDFNDAKECVAFTETLSDLSDAIGGTVLGIGHTAKGKRDEVTMFGSVVLQANMDFIMFLEKDEDSDVITLRADLGREEGHGNLHFKAVPVSMPDWKRPGRVFIPASAPIVEEIPKDGKGYTKGETDLIFSAVDEILKRPETAPRMPLTAVANEVTQVTGFAGNTVLAVLKRAYDHELKQYRSKSELLIGSDTLTHASKRE